MDILHKCNCGELGTWCYMPASTAPGNKFFCDNCVPRGCECNNEYLSEEYDNNPVGIQGEDWEWNDDKESWYHIDKVGREYPCCEFEYEKEGWRKNFGEWDMAEQMKKFVETNARPIYLYNEFLNIYVRNSFRIIDGVKHKFLDLANISVIDEALHNHGIFTRLIKDILLFLDDTNIYVECIHNPAVITVLNKFNFKSQDIDDLEKNMYIIR